MSTTTTTDERPWPIAKTPLTLISFFLPIVGWILGYMWREEHPAAKAHAYKFAMIGLIVGIVINVALRIVA